ncbi:MAG: ECF transporter S component [Caldisericia bacterium]|nr:ECF transporter S component [Caldisericia bacterium]
MSNEKKVKSNKQIQWIARLAVLIALTIAVQMLHLPQYITGPIVNFMLLVSVMLLGAWGGVALGILTPVIALLAGILGRPELIPVIVIGNAMYSLAFYLLRIKGKTFLFSFIGIIVGSFLKFGVFALAIAYVVQLPPPLAKMFGFPQLLTALAGGVLALLVEKALKHTNLLNH